MPWTALKEKYFAAAQGGVDGAAQEALLVFLAIVDIQDGAVQVFQVGVVQELAAIQDGAEQEKAVTADGRV